MLSSNVTEVPCNEIEKNQNESQIKPILFKNSVEKQTAVKAAQYGDIETLKKLIESGKIDPNEPDCDDIYLLHWAAINDRLEIAKYLVDLGVKIDPVGGELRATPLNWATRADHLNMCEFLIENGADVLFVDIEGFSIIHVACISYSSSIVSLLLNKGVEADLRDSHGATPLMNVAQRVNSDDLGQILIGQNANINAQDNDGNTPLHYAVLSKNNIMSQFLLSQGASLFIKNKKNHSPLYIAFIRNKLILWLIFINVIFKFLALFYTAYIENIPVKFLLFILTILIFI